MRKLLSLLIIVTITSNTFGQILVKKHIDDWIKETYVKSDITEYILYVLNGEPIESRNLNEKLSKYKITDISTILYLDKMFNENSIFCVRDDGAIIIETFNSKKQSKLLKKEFKDLKKELNKFDPKEIKDYPAVIIDDMLIKPLLTKNQVYDINTKSILSINIIDSQTNTNRYGPNAKNGLVIIYTKKPVANTIYSK